MSLLQLVIQGLGTMVFLSLFFSKTTVLHLSAVWFMRIKISYFRCGKHQRRSDPATDEMEFGYKRFVLVGRCIIW